MLNVEQTIISQYANSPTLNRLIQNMNQYIDQSANIAAFYNMVWNVDTAVGFGLDIWGRIVGVNRILQIPGNLNYLGFENGDVPPDWQPFGGGTFYTGANDTTSYELPDDGFRTLILTKALANITATTSQALNTLLKNLFPNRGRAYVIDNLDMTMTFYFEFQLTTVEYAILTQSGALPHPAAVGFRVVVVPTETGLFGFSQQPGAQPWGQGVFYLPP